jgi:peptide/nickel transport system permease protein
MTRGEVLSLKSRPYVEAGRLLGYSHFRLLWRHILPGIVPTLAIISAGNFATAILLESGLSFLGIGVQPPTPSWGSMVKEGYSAILFGSRHLIIAPTLALILLVTAFSQLGSAISRQRQA